MINASKIFIQKQSKSRKDDFGQQIGIEKQLFGTLTQAKVSYSRKPEWDYIQQKTNEFIKNRNNDLSRLRMFKNVLKQKIINGKQSVATYNLNQLADFLPWVFSTQLMFEPYRSALYCLKSGIDPAQAWVVYATIPSQLINTVVDEAVYESVKYLAPYLQRANAVFDKTYIGMSEKVYAVSASFLYQNYQYLKKQFEEGIAKIAQGGLNVLKWATTPLGKIIQWAVGGNTYEGFYKKQTSNQVDKTQKENYFKHVGMLIKQITKDLRAYGSIVINFGYLKKIAQKKTLNGQQYYFLWDHPELLITCRQSMPEVYVNRNGTLELISQSLFNIDFLRGMVIGDVVKLGGQLFKQVKRQTTMTEQELKPMKDFYSKYLNYSPPALTEEEKKTAVLKNVVLNQIKQQNTTIAKGLDVYNKWLLQKNKK